MSIGAYVRLLRAGFVLAREGAFAATEGQPLPKSARRWIGLARLIERREVRRTGRVANLARALERLGPTWVKLGQLLATRPDIVGPGIAADLSALQDKMPPFDPTLVPGLLEDALGEVRAAQLRDLSPPVAAASIAQVHKARLVDAKGERVVAVKVLRPGIEERFARDLEAVRTFARRAENFSPEARRLRPLAVAETLERTALIELDLRLEAAAISEMAQNLEGETGFGVPRIEWDHCARNVLTTNWIDGIPIADHAALDAAGIDRRKLAVDLMRAFLRQAIERGYFHADMHPGNLFVDPGSGAIMAVDFGIMGRIGRAERRFLAEILYGFIRRDYERIARLHIEIGYVPAHHAVEDFAQALRSIGEPLFGRPARDISMGNVLAQLFEVTRLFDMQTRTELLLLQKTMVTVEGVARALDPELDMWATAEPVVSAWVRREAGPLGQMEKAVEILGDLARTLPKIPALIDRYEALLEKAEREQARRPAYLSPWFVALATLSLLAVAAAAIASIF